MRTSNRVALLAVLLVLFLGLAPRPAAAISLTFANATGTTPQLFTIYGNVLGTENINTDAPTSTFWAEFWPIAGLSDFALLPDLVSFTTNDSAFGAMIVSQSKSTGEIGQFTYSENIGGTDPALLQHYFHQVRVQQHESPLPPGEIINLQNLLNVSGAFAFRETTELFTNYTRDGSTVPIRTSVTVEGTLTLVDFDLSVSAPVRPVPEPSTLLLFGTGLAGFVISRRRFSTRV